MSSEVSIHRQEEGGIFVKTDSRAKRLMVNAKLPYWACFVTFCDTALSEAASDESSVNCEFEKRQKAASIYFCANIFLQAIYWDKMM